MIAALVIVEAGAFVIFKAPGLQRFQWPIMARPPAALEDLTG